MAKDISIILVDDHVIVRSGLKALIEDMGGYKVSREYSNGKLFTEALVYLDPLPDVVIMDLGMPEMDGEETMRWLQQRFPKMKVLILTWDNNEKKIIELFRLGVRGYLLKNCTAEILKKAIHDTHIAGYYHSELLQTAMLKDQQVKDEKQLVHARVSEREKEFLQLVCDKQEYTYDQMADIMKVHRRTVDGYRESLFVKFKIKSKTGLVLFAIKHGLIVV